MGALVPQGRLRLERLAGAVAVVGGRRGAAAVTIEHPHAPVPTHARVVIVGGGIAGCSTAYHLTKLGWRDVVLLEQGTAHLRHDLARGGARRPDARDAQRDAHEPLRHRALLDARAGDGARDRLEAMRLAQRRDARPSGWRCSSARWRARRASASSSSSSRPRRPARVAPILRTDDLAGAVWIPGDGKANPTDLTQSLAQGRAQRRRAHRRGRRA